MQARNSNLQETRRLRTSSPSNVASDITAGWTSELWGRALLVLRPLLLHRGLVTFPLRGQILPEDVDLGDAIPLDIFHHFLSFLLVRFSCYLCWETEFKHRLERATGVQSDFETDLLISRELCQAVLSIAGLHTNTINSSS